MSLRLAARLRRCRAAMLLLAALVAMQALLGAVASAGDVRVAGRGLGDLTVICHGDRAADPGNPAAPDPDKSQHPCCLACAAGAAPAVLGASSVAPRGERGRSAEHPVRAAEPTPVAPRAVRAGLSQAPPHRI
jgi:hypothetical protein